MLHKTPSAGFFWAASVFQTSIGTRATIESDVTHEMIATSLTMMGVLASAYLLSLHMQSQVGQDANEIYLEINPTLPRCWGKLT